MRNKISRQKEQRIRKHSWIKFKDESDIDILDLLKQRNANKKKLIEALDRDIQLTKERKRAKK